jgi:DNA-binding NtrC family response regulator
VTKSVASRAAVQSKLLWVGSGPQSRWPDLRLALSDVDVHYTVELDNVLPSLKRFTFDAVILAINGLLDENLRPLEEILSSAPSLPVIVCAQDCTHEQAAQFSRCGAFHVFTGEPKGDQLRSVLARAVAQTAAAIPRQLEAPAWRRFLIGQSPVMTQLCEIIQIIAARKVTVLISGETGTGKEVVARAIHAASNRSALPLVAVNCTALPSNLVESELFGHAKGAFTGAYASRLGRFEQAHRGTIFLDEIGDLPLEAQAKLLRVLQEQEFERVGSSETVRVDVRVIAASNVELEAAVRERRFREDLFYRLNVVPIHLPPLRERREDIPLLLDYFVEKTSRSEGIVGKEISPEAVDFLVQQDWPGNVRQLEHAVQMAFALSGDRDTLYPTDFYSRHRSGTRSALPSGRPLLSLGPGGIDFDKAVSQFEFSLLNQALALSGGNKARAADLLRIKRTTLLAKIKVLEERLTQRTSEAGASTASSSSSELSALILDPDAAVRRLISRTLEKFGFHVLETESQQEALDLLDCWHDDIALLFAPTSMGDRAAQQEDFATRIQARFPKLQTILIGSSKPRPNYHSTAGRHFLQRPFSADDLTDFLNKLGLLRSGQMSEVLCA